ncbi:BCCT family transporter [Galactobacter valiniphilus]|uniref:BCCT family transporter n=1 Tax=Galactobacter valiniphilus TaxID=2676122 RepID=A0A399JB83_9MICC|nr:BCCT family transporter [Galactobacter valiniphilus]RII41282.1 BCCT family transporter [Galactobacter valiniphilus]
MASTSKHTHASPSAEGAPTDQREHHPGIAPWVFWPTAILVLAFVAATIINPDAMSAGIGAVQGAIIANFSWWYILLAFGFVLFCIYLGLSRKGNVKLGRPEDEPEFSLVSWFSLLFAAGMGIGLVFYGVTEPLTHYATPRPSLNTEGMSQGAIAQEAMATTFLHWGFQPWAIYVVVGLALAHAIHRRGRPLAVRWALEPLLGEKAVRGGWGNAVDVIALVGTVFGVATSLGLGVTQIAAGLASLGVVDPNNHWIEYAIIALVTCVVLWSVLSGVARGMKLLSNTNLILAAGLLLFVLIVGPTQFLAKEIVQSVGHYLQNWLGMSTDASAFAGADGAAWQASWSTFYWGWWMSWAPFVGVFIARISRGRTVKEFVMGVMLVPALITFVWFGVLGGTAISNEMNRPEGYASVIGADGAVDANSALFQVLEQLPAGGMLVVGAILLSAIFFVTSADSGSLVMAMLATGGDAEPRPWIRVFFTLATSGLAAALLLAGGLSAIQTLAITIALPFSVIMVLMCIATAKALARNVARADRLRRDALVADLKEKFNLDSDDDAVSSEQRLADRWWSGLTSKRRRTLVQGLTHVADALPERERRRLFGRALPGSPGKSTTAGGRDSAHVAAAGGDARGDGAASASHPGSTPGEAPALGERRDAGD